MKFARLGPLGFERPVVIDRNRTLDLSDLAPDIDGAFLAAGGVARVREALEAGILPEVPDADELRVGSPIARPSAVICIGMNYAAHAAESGLAPPDVPILFLKTPNTVVGPNDAVTIPKGSVKTDWEAELGVVIGQRASYLESPAHSFDHVAGFVACNDLSERDFQIAMSGDQWRKCKSSPGFNPGTVDTPFVARLLTKASDPAAERAALEARQPHGRLDSAEEVAAAITYLASPLSGSTTGTSIAVDGGMAGLRVRRTTSGTNT